MGKAQVTLFLIVGLLFLFTFSVVGIAIYSNISTDTQETITSINQNIAEHKGLSEYARRCLEISLEKGIKTLALQGGYFYSGQPGSLTNEKLPIQREFLGQEVSYLITPAKTAEKLVFFPPLYPCPYKYALFYPRYCKFENKANNIEIGNIRLGESKLPSLHKAGTGFSIEEQLQAYLINKTKECTNFKELTSLPEFQKFKVTEGEITANITFRDNDISAEIIYPLIFESKKGMSVTKKLEFSIFHKAPFKSMYEVANELITLENQLLTFDIEEDSKNRFYKDISGDKKALKLAKTGFTVDVIRDINDDLIVIKDTSVTIGAEPFMFVFARENRPPVLEYIEKNGKSAGKQKEQYEARNPGSLEIKAFDPDEDKLIFSLGGFQTEYYMEKISQEEVLSFQKPIEKSPSSISSYEPSFYAQNYKKVFSDGVEVTYNLVGNTGEYFDEDSSNKYYFYSNNNVQIKFNGNILTIFMPERYSLNAKLDDTSATPNANSITKTYSAGPKTATISLSTGNFFAVDYFVIDGKKYEIEPFADQENIIVEKGKGVWLKYDKISNDENEGWIQNDGKIITNRKNGNVTISFIGPWIDISLRRTVSGGNIKVYYDEDKKKPQTFDLATSATFKKFSFPGDYWQKEEKHDHKTKESRKNLYLCPDSLNDETCFYSGPNLGSAADNGKFLQFYRHTVRIEGPVEIKFFEIPVYASLEPSLVSETPTTKTATLNIPYDPSKDTLQDLPSLRDRSHVLTVAVSDNQYSDFQEVRIK